MIKLNKNESYWLLNEALVDAAHSSSWETLSTYPDYTALKEELALYAGVTPEMILVTPGSDAGIEHIVRTYSKVRERCVLPVPTFYGYESILERAGVELIPVPYKNEQNNFIFPCNETLETLPGAKILFLCNPNNPLGSVIPEDDLTRILDAARTHSVLVVSDEAYFEFSGQTLVPLLNEYENLIIVRTLSKGFGLSGARIGYTIASSTRIAEMMHDMLPWPVAHQSVSAACALLGRNEEVCRRVELVKAERVRFEQELRTLPQIVVYPSEANFVLVRVPNAKEVQRALADADIQVALGEPMSRFADAKTLLKDTIRIAIPSPEDRPKVTAVLKVLLTG